METLSRDVLPAGVRRRLSRRDGRLPVILMGELMAGMALGLVWPVLTSPPPPIPQTAMTAVRAPAPLAPPAPAAALPVIVHVPKHEPRNPFGVPQGIEANLQPSVDTAPPPVAAAPPTSVVVPPPVGVGAPPAPAGAATPPPASDRTIPPPPVIGGVPIPPPLGGGGAFSSAE